MSQDLQRAAIRPMGDPYFLADETSNDSDKTITVPDNEIWNLKFIAMTFYSTATVGNRWIRCIIARADGTGIFESDAQAYQAASQTRKYIMAPGLPSAAPATLATHTMPLPEMRLTPGMTIRVYDSAAIDPAADDMYLHIHVIREAVPDV